MSHMSTYIRNILIIYWSI